MSSVAVWHREMEEGLGPTTQHQGVGDTNKSMHLN